MSKFQDIICAIEFGTSKISILIGSLDEENQIHIEGFGSVPSAGSVVKGEIVDVNKATNLLEKAIEKADNDNLLSRCSYVTCLVTGCNIDTKLLSTTTVVKNPQRIVTEETLADAYDSIEYISSLPEEFTTIKLLPSHHEIEGRQIANPIDNHCNQIRSFYHSIFGSANRTSIFKQVIRNTELFENLYIDLIFTPHAIYNGIVSELEQSSGVLVIDMGAGTTDFLVVDDCIKTLGMIQVGFDHVINDLAIGLNLPFEYCKRILENGDISRAISENKEFFEINNGKLGQQKKIPISSFSTIIDSRIQEIFDIIYKKISQNDPKLLKSLKAGGLLTGGAAIFPRCKEIFQERFTMDCYERSPGDNLGAESELSSPRYSALWGALKFAADELSSEYPEGKNFSIIDFINVTAQKFGKGTRNFFKSIRL